MAGYAIVRNGELVGLATSYYGIISEVAGGDLVKLSSEPTVSQIEQFSAAPDRFKLVQDGAWALISEKGLVTLEVDKPEIRAAIPSVDVATITIRGAAGQPVTLKVNGQAFLVEDETLEVAAEVSGTYRIKVADPNYYSGWVEVVAT